MKEIEVRDNTFYILIVKQEEQMVSTIFDEMPFKKIRDHLKNGISPENIKLLATEIRDEKLETSIVSWSAIAVGIAK